MRIDRSFLFWLAALIALLGVFIWLAGCDSVPSASTSVPIVGTSDEGDVRVDATTRTEAETLGDGGVSAEHARDIRTFGLDEGTQALLVGALSGFWKQTGVVTCVVVGIGLFLLCVRLEMPEMYRIGLMAIGLAMAAIPVLKWALGL